MANDTLLTHSISTNTKNNAARFSHNSIQGHHHSEFCISYFADHNLLRWSMTVGCLLDPKSVAARYAAGAVLKRPVVGIGALIGGKGPNTLIISDPHLPYQHPDSFDFLYKAAVALDCERILCTGDMFDHHQGSYHESEPDAPDAETEYLMAQNDAKELQDIFPEMVITNGNHDNIPKRKMKTVGLPFAFASDYNKMYDLEDGWKWEDQFYFESYGAKPVLIPMELNRRGRWTKRIDV